MIALDAQDRKLTPQEKVVAARVKNQAIAMQKNRETQLKAIGEVMVERVKHIDLEERVRARILRVERDARWVVLSRFISGFEDLHCREVHMIRIESQAAAAELQAGAAAAQHRNATAALAATATGGTRNGQSCAVA